MTTTPADGAKDGSSGNLIPDRLGLLAFSEIFLDFLGDSRRQKNVIFFVISFMKTISIFQKVLFDGESYIFIFRN